MAYDSNEEPVTDEDKAAAIGGAHGMSDFATSINDNNGQPTVPPAVNDSEVITPSRAPQHLVPPWRRRRSWQRS